MKAKELHNQIISKIEGLYERQEASSIAGLLLDHFNISRNDLIMDTPVHVPLLEIDQITDRLLESEPIQYILNTAWFYGRPFYVNQHTLIPRPETEELCQHILTKTQGQNIHILDIGTGSGCIPVTLKAENPELTLSGLDVSIPALEVARKNSRNLSTDVLFIHQDILELDNLLSLPLTKSIDAIVSNPPYVTQTDKVQMNDNVLKFEPQQALFVEDNQPLIFYQKITQLAQKADSVRWIAFEINEAYGHETTQLLRSHGFPETEVLTDLQGKDRMVFGYKTNTL